MTEQNPDPTPAEKETARKHWDDEAKKLGRFNLAIFGKTGVGKSTLINSIFGADVAATGVGRPVTSGSHLYVARTGALGLYDTQGLEIGTSSEALLTEVTNFITSKRTADTSEHIHAVYYCIRAAARVDPAEQRFVRGLHDLGLPVFLVVTQVHKKGAAVRAEHLEFAQYANDLLLPIYLGRPFITAALADPELGYEAHGLDPLLEATYEAVPEAAKTAFAAAQIVDRGLKRTAARKRVAAAVTMAGAAGATPIPFSDAALLVPIQMAMMASIAQIYRVPMEGALTASLAATSMATNAGRAVVGSLLKFLPGVGSAAGSAISAAVAGSFTLAMGTAWTRVCEMMLDGKFGPLTHMNNAQIRTVFMKEFNELFKAGLQQLRNRPKA